MALEYNGSHCGHKLAYRKVSPGPDIGNEIAEGDKPPGRPQPQGVLLLATIFSSQAHCPFRMHATLRNRVHTSSETC